MRAKWLPRPRLHGTGRIWNRAEIRPFSPVYTRIRPVIGGLKLVRFHEKGRISARSQIRPVYRVNGVLVYLSLEST
jgi:hypothetical protein